MALTPVPRPECPNCHTVNWRPHSPQVQDQQWICCLDCGTPVLVRTHTGEILLRGKP